MTGGTDVGDVETRGLAGGPVTGDERGGDDGQGQAEEKAPRRRPRDGPTEEGDVDDEAENPGEGEPGDDAEKRTEQADDARLPEDERLDLSARGTDGAQDADLAAALGDEDGEAEENPERGDDNADGLQDVSDGKSLVENAEDLLAQFLVRLDEVIAVGRDLRAQLGLKLRRGEARILVDVDTDPVDGVVLPEFPVGLPVDENDAAFGRIVDIDSGDFEVVASGGGGEVDGIAEAEVEAAKEGLADQHRAVIDGGVEGFLRIALREAQSFDVARDGEPDGGELDLLAVELHAKFAE